MVTVHRTETEWRYTGLVKTLSYIHTDKIKHMSSDAVVWLLSNILTMHTLLDKHWYGSRSPWMLHNLMDQDTVGHVPTDLHVHIAYLNFY